MFELCARTLAESGGSSIISKFKQFKNIGYHTFTKLYDTGVNSVIKYYYWSKYLGIWE